MKPLLNFKDSYIMHVNNSYRFAKDDAIMSFQTNFNGQFEPIIIPLSGTLRWVVDGLEQITNTPSYALVGNTVNVAVYANDVIQNEIVGCDLDARNIIGVLDFSYFTATDTMQMHNNSGLTNVIFNNTVENVITELTLFSCSLSALDLSSVRINGTMRANNNPGMASVTLSSYANLSAFFSVENCNLSTLDLTNLTFTAGQFNANDNSNLTSITFSTNENIITSRIYVDDCNLATLDLSNVRFSTASLYCFRNANLTSLIFSTYANTITAFRGYSCNFSNLDFTNVSLSGVFYYWANSNLSSLIFSSSNGNISEFIGYSCNLSSLDLSNINITSTFRINANANLTSLIPPNLAGSLSIYNFQTCALNQTSIDATLLSLNTYYSSNAPTRNLTYTADAGTNSSPTGGAANTDLVNLDTVVYPNAGYDFIYSINAA